jgi:nitrite reductase/ring-hydroxylating ferredoxin subunit
LLKRAGRIFVLAEKCSHLGGPLADGKLEGETVTCPWHGSKFSLRDGSVINGPATYSQPCFEVRVRNGQVEVRTPRGTIPEPY